MNIDIDLLSVHVKMEYCKRKFMLHCKIPVCIFQRLRDHRTFYITPVYKKVLKVTVSSCDHRFSQISCDPQAPFFIVYIQKISRHIAAIYIIYYVFELSAPRSAQFLLSVIQKNECDLRMGKCQMHEQILHVSGLRHRSL